MAIREGRWDCKYCGRVGNRGPDNHCLGCGAPRDQGVKFYLPPDAAEVTDTAALERAKKGPDWRCGYCGDDNPADAKFCGGCGAGSDGSEGKRAVREIRDQPPAAPKPVTPPGGKKKILGIVLGVVALVLGGLWFFVFRTHNEDLTVTGHSWERVVEVEKFKTVTEEAWEGEVPAGGREVSRSREVFRTEKVQTGTERVKVGTRDLGNGYFEDVFEDRPVYRDNPVYRDKIRFLIERWKKDRDLSASAKDLAPRWPEVKLAEKEREGRRHEIFRVHLRDKEGKERVFQASDEARWRTYQPGQSYRATVRASGEVVDLALPSESP
ncbi:MAG: hypothetical protein GYA21_10010 [Myxococcales bacterium]|nr:hypothetical protein [Myxococcales bacterium]